MQKEYKTRHDLVGKVIHRELCKKFEFDHMNKWYMHNPESILSKELNDYNNNKESEKRDKYLDLAREL